MTPAEAAGAVAKASLDVLVDYDGTHDFNSIALLAHRPAPIAATWLGFAQTPGMGCRGSGSGSSSRSSSGDGGSGATQRQCSVDYLIADKVVVDPTEARSKYSESLVLLPHSSQPQDELQNDVA